MSQHEHTLIEATNPTDDWGDFSAVISQLEEQEQAKTELVNSTEPTEAAAEDKADAMEGLLNIVFTLTEQVTSVLSGVEFEFDQKGKTAVIEAAQPVFTKHGQSLMGVFGNYIEEATLMLAIIGLVYASKKQVQTLKQQQMEAAREHEVSVVATA